MKPKNKSSFLTRMTASIADDVSLSLMLTEEVFRRGGLLSIVDRLAAGEYDFDIDETHPLIRELTPAYAMWLCEAAAVHRRWFTKPGRIAFSFHPDMITNLQGSTSPKIPGDALRHMAHRSPLVLFTRSIPTTTMEGEPAQLRGFFIFGAWRDSDESSNWAIRETDDPDATDIGLLMIISTSKDAEDLQFDGLMLPLGQTFTVAEAVERTMMSYHLTDEVEWLKGYRERTRDALTLAINLLLYICDDEADHVPMNVAAPNPRLRQRGFKDPGKTQFVASGWVDGPALERAHREDQRTRSTGQGTGREHPYHRRRGHFRIVRFGVRRASEKLRWIKPYEVRKDKKDGAAARVIEVKPD